MRVGKADGGAVAQRRDERAVLDRVAADIGMRAGGERHGCRRESAAPRR